MKKGRGRAREDVPGGHGEAEVGAGSHALGPGLWPEPKVFSVLSLVYLSVPENRSQGLSAPAVSETAFPWILPRRVRPFWLPGLPKKDSYQTRFSFFLCLLTSISLQMISPQKISIQCLCLQRHKAKIISLIKALLSFGLRRI